MNRLDKDFGPNFYITMAPVGTGMLPTFGLNDISGINYQSLDAQATSTTRPSGKLVSWYNVQLYNGWGDASSQVYYDLIILYQQFAANRIVLGVLDSSHDGGSGWYSLATYQNTIKQLRANFPTFGGVVGWEYFNAGDSDGLATPDLWVKGISAALSAPTTSLPKANYATTPAAAPKSPWPSQAAMLGKLGVNWAAANNALNITKGNLVNAEKMLGLKTT